MALAQATGAVIYAARSATPDLRFLFSDRSADQPMVVFCNSSNRSILGASLLIRRGFRNVTQVLGGTISCENAGYPFVESQE